MWYFLNVLYSWFNPSAFKKITSQEKSRNYIPPELRDPIKIQAARQHRKIVRNFARKRIVETRQRNKNNIVVELYLQQEKEANKKIQRLEHRKANITEYPDYQDMLLKINEITYSIDDIVLYLNDSPEAKTADIINRLSIIRDSISATISHN